jgi:hypothetical protein
VHDITSWHPHVFGYCLQGTKGCFEFDRAALLDGDQLTPWKDLDTLESEHGIGNLIKDSDGHNSAWAGCLKTLLAAIEQDSTPPQDLFDSLHITAIGWAAAESMKSRALTKVTQFD